MVYLRMLQDYSPAVGLVRGRVERFSPRLAARLIADGIAEEVERGESMGFDEPPLNKQMKAAPRKK